MLKGATAYAQKRSTRTRGVGERWETSVYSLSLPSCTSLKGGPEQVNGKRRSGKKSRRGYALESAKENEGVRSQRSNRGKLVHFGYKHCGRRAVLI